MLHVYLEKMIGNAVCTIQRLRPRNSASSSAVHITNPANLDLNSNINDETCRCERRASQRQHSLCNAIGVIRVIRFGIGFSILAIRLSSALTWSDEEMSKRVY
jgi:hypothetical protein